MRFCAKKQPAQCPRRLVEGPGPRRRQEVVQLPHSRRPASRQPARRVAAARRRQRQLQQGLAALRAADGHGVHGPQSLHVAVLRVEAPRRVCRRSEGARVLHRLFSVWMPRSTTAMALRSSGRFVRRTASAGSSRSSVANSLPRSVVTTKFPSSPVSSRAARLVARPTSAFLFCRGSTAASRVKTSITTRPYFVFPRVFCR